MGKILLLALAVWLLLTILKRYRRNLDTMPPPARTDDMVRCAHCGIHIPLSESLQHNGKRYCCEAHCGPGKPS